MATDGKRKEHCEQRHKGECDDIFGKTMNLMGLKFECGIEQHKKVYSVMMIKWVWEGLFVIAAVTRCIEFLDSPFTNGVKVSAFISSDVKVAKKVLTLLGMNEVK